MPRGKSNDIRFRSPSLRTYLLDRWRGKAMVLDTDSRTAFCRRFADNLVLLADVKRNNFEPGEWIAARFFYSPICEEWVALSYRAEPDHKRIETQRMELDGEVFDAVRRSNMDTR